MTSSAHETAVGLPSGSKSNNAAPAAASSAAALKRDRKKSYILGRLVSLEEKYAEDKDAKYWDRLQKIQIDTALVQRFDPYTGNALDILEEMREQQHKVHPSTTFPDNARSIIELAGPQFREWAQNISDEIETRDFHLTRLHHEYESRRKQYYNTHQYKTETAKREHDALCKTLRDRLINALSSKRTRLLKEKEALEISDSSALLLHPNQFSFSNPDSPGVTHAKRATRMRKDPEDYATLVDSKKRKRPTNDEDGAIPIRRALDTSLATPFWQSEKLRLSSLQEGPLYSVDKLFSEKELTLTYNHAALAAQKYVLRHQKRRVYGDETALRDPDGSLLEEEEEVEEDLGNGNGLSSTGMERQMSHQTRSTKHANLLNFTDDKVLGWEAITNFEKPSNLDLLHSMKYAKMPVLQPQWYLKSLRLTDQNLTTPLSGEDIESDMAVMNVFKQFDQSNRVGASLTHPNGLRDILEAAATPYAEGKYVAYLGRSRANVSPSKDPMGTASTTAVSHLRESNGTLSHSTNAKASPSKPSSTNITTTPSSTRSGGENPVQLAVAAAANVAMNRQVSQNGAVMSRQGSTRGKNRRNH